MIFADCLPIEAGNAVFGAKKGRASAGPTSGDLVFPFDFRAFSPLAS